MIQHCNLQCGITQPILRLFLTYLYLVISVDDSSSSEEGEDDAIAALRKHDTDDEGIERDHDDHELLLGHELRAVNNDNGDRGQQSSLESSSSSSGHHRGGKGGRETKIGQIFFFS